MPSFSQGLMRGVQTSFAIMDRKRDIAAQAEEREMRKQEFGQLVKLRGQQIEAALLSNRASRQRIGQSNELFPLQKRQAEQGIAREDRVAAQQESLFPIQEETARLTLGKLKREEKQSTELYDIQKRQLDRTEGLQTEGDNALDEFLGIYKATSRMKADMESGMKTDKVTDEDLVIFANGLERLSGSQDSPVDGIQIVPVDPQTAQTAQTGGYVPEMMVAAHIRRQNGKNEYMQADPKMLMEQAMAMRSALMQVAVTQAKGGDSDLLESLMDSDAQDLPDRAATVEYYRSRGFSPEEADKRAQALYGHGPDGGKDKDTDTVYIREVEYFKKELGVDTKTSMKLVKQMRNKETDDLKLAIDLMKASRKIKDVDTAMAKIKEARALMQSNENGDGAAAQPAPGGGSGSGQAPAASQTTYLGESVPANIGSRSLANWQRNQDRRKSGEFRRTYRLDPAKFPKAVKWSQADALRTEFPASEWLIVRTKNDYALLINKSSGEISIPQPSGG